MALRMNQLIIAVLAICLLAPSLSCGDDEEVTSEEEARLAYFGLDKMVENAMDLGFKGFSEASSANIPTQNGTGALKGTITVGGKVDQGSSDNKEMRLTVELADYQDVDPPKVVYTTSAPSALDMSLKKVPNGDMTGTMTGRFLMTGELEGEVELNLTLSAQLEPDPDNPPDGVRRKLGTGRITGTATSRYGTYPVDITR